MLDNCFVFILNNFSAWVWNAARNDMFDYIPIVTDSMVLAIMKNAIERDSWGLYFRPFMKEAWIMIGATTVTIFITLLIISYLAKHLKNESLILKKSYRVVIFIAWIFFLLTEVYYEGALTMFFTTEIGIPFNSIKDVMRSYPDWRLMMRSGFEAYYIDHVDSGDIDYIIYYIKGNYLLQFILLHYLFNRLSFFRRCRLCQILGAG